MLQSIISQSRDLNITLPETVTEVLTPGVDVTPTSLYWFTPYLSSKFPEITCDKTYFFLYSTDHDGGSGGIWWGKGDNLDLSDFVEISSTPIITGHQAETPLLVRFPNSHKKLHLFYHTWGLEPGNNGQETRLITTNDDLLHTANWIDEGRPLGFVTGQDHSGYFNYWHNGEQFIGTSYEKGATLPTYDGKWVYHTSQDGVTWARGGEVERYENIDSDKRYGVSFNEYFKRGNQWYWLGTAVTRDNYAATKNDFLILSKANSDFVITEQVAVLYTSEYISTWKIYIEGNTAHCYLHHDNDDPLGYTTFDLSGL